MAKIRNGIFFFLGEGKNSGKVHTARSAKRKKLLRGDAGGGGYFNRKRIGGWKERKPDQGEGTGGKECRKDALFFMQKGGELGERKEKERKHGR